MNGVIDSMDMSLSKLQEIEKEGKADVLCSPWGCRVRHDRVNEQQQDLVDRVSEKPWTEVHHIIQNEVTKTIPKEKKCKKAKGLSEENLKLADKRKETKGKRERERYTQLNAEFQRVVRYKTTFLSEQCKETEKNNRMGQTGTLFKETGDIKGIFHARMGKIKDRNSKDFNRTRRD